MVNRFSLQFFVVVSAAFLYAVIRYVFFGPVQATQIPVYLGNKATSFAAVICFALAAWTQWKNGSGKRWGKAAISLSFVHVLLSLAILKPVYFGKFFEGDFLNWKGGLIVLFGALATLGIWHVSRLRGESSKRDRLALFSMAAVALHIVWMGVPGWAKPSTWHGGLPPISLLSFAVCLAAVIFSARVFYRSK